MPLTSLPSPAPGAVARARRRYAGAGAEAPSSERLVVLLYERLLKDLDDAAAALAGGRSAHEPLTHAQEIVDALDTALDTSTWPGAEGLSALYAHLITQLVAANLERDPRRVAACREVVAPLAEAWKAAWVELNTGGVASS